MTADEKRLQAIFTPCDIIMSYMSDEEGMSASIEYLRIFYLQKDYQAILQFVEKKDLQQLSNRELFWAADAGYHVCTEILTHL